ncbi:MAG: isoleucine--tRNA ligase [Verrucomicrobiae bacterium]|nr:isoleucine--tRNA ligase [Verrucomicrobiae bacterium]
MNYKDTLNLPKTSFPMKADLVKREPAFLERWDQEKLYFKIQEKRRDAPVFILHDGPPFANGDVHMGTALNKILKDIIVKSKSMMGFRAPYIPGWDCHGLPIEFKVVKSQGNLTPVQVRQKSEEFARKYIEIQRRQFKRLGVLGDWEHPYLTLDHAYEADVLRVFAAIVDKGLVYRSKKPVYWSSGAQTALAEAEVEYVDKESPSIYVKFDVAGMPGTSVMIWTTTPWTLPANLAVAIHPRLRYARYKLGDETVILCEELPAESYANLGVQPLPDGNVPVAELLKFKLKHPFLPREVPVLTADYVAADTGTGCVHTAPGHGQEDYHTAKHLGLLSPVDDQGRFTAECEVPEWVGKYVFDANQDVLALLQKTGKLVRTETIRHSYPHCWRSKTPVIFRAVEQWFIKVEELKAQALAAIDQVKWVPEWGRNRIRGTVESRSDWCISRQRSWGVPLPIFYAEKGEPILKAEIILKVADLVEKHGTNIWFEKSAAELAGMLGLPAGVTKRNDTLDVWIDSGSSSRAVLQRHPEQRFPADLYLEGSDQHRGWFQSSLLISLAANGGKPPYKTVVTNGFLVDLDGRKISKSSTYEKPKDSESFVNKYGADVVRLWVSSENYQNDVPLSEEIFTRIGETYRSVRNTLRILLGNLADFDPKRHAVDLNACKDRAEVELDRWMLGKLQGLIREIRKGYEEYEFHRVYHALNSFCAVEVSALYVDITKDRLYCDAPDSLRRRATQTVMRAVAGALARLSAPILCFTAEEAWNCLPGVAPDESVHLQLMPEPDDRLVDSDLETRFERWLQLRTMVAAELEKARQSKQIGKSVDARVCLELKDSKELAAFKGREECLAEMFIVSQVELKAGDTDRAIVTQPLGKKCARSWRWDVTVGSDSGYPDLSARDAAAVKEIGKRKSQGV